MKTTCELIEIDASDVRAVWGDARSSGVGDVVTNYCFCQALFAFRESGMSDRLMAVESVATAGLLEGLDEALGAALLKYLTIRGVVEPVEDGCRLTARGRLICAPEPMALIGYYAEAYAPVLSRLTPLLTRKIQYEKDVTRDAWALSRHCEVLARSFATGVILRALDEVGARWTLDLGCGNAAFLIDACKRDPGFRGIGIENSPEAIEFARQRVAEEHLSDRIELVLGDAFHPETWPATYRKADSYMAVGTLHEHFRQGESAIVDLLNKYAEMMASGVKMLLLVEPEIHYNDGDAHFFLVHALTKQGLPRRRELWLETIAKSNLRCRRIYHIPDIPFSFAHYDLVRA